MKIILIIFAMVLSNVLAAQNALLHHKVVIDRNLKTWTSCYNNFNLSSFYARDTVVFDNNSPRDFAEYNNFMSIYNPVVTYSSDGLKFIDIYSYQLNLEKKANIYYAYPDIDQAVFLCHPKKKYWNRIFFGASSGWIDEVTWISANNFILAGTKRVGETNRAPFLLLGDIKKQTLIRFETSDMAILQKRHYTSPKLNKIVIKGL